MRLLSAYQTHRQQLDLYIYILSKRICFERIGVLKNNFQEQSWWALSSIYINSIYAV